jgi:hypothetical protein
MRLFYISLYIKFPTCFGSLRRHLQAESYLIVPFSTQQLSVNTYPKFWRNIASVERPHLTSAFGQVFTASCCVKNLTVEYDSNETPNQMHRSIVKFIALSRRRCSTCFGHYYAHHQEPFQTAVAAIGFRMNAEVDVFPAVVGLLG